MWNRNHHMSMGRGSCGSLLIDSQQQRLGYAREIIRQVVQLVREHGAVELLTSDVPAEGGPSGFYAGHGFVP